MLLGDVHPDLEALELLAALMLAVVAPPELAQDQVPRDVDLVLRGLGPR